MNNIGKILLVLLLCTVSITARSIGSPKFNAELAGVTMIIKKVDLNKRVISTRFFEFSYNANTRFVTQAGDVKPSVLKAGDQVRISVSQKKLLSLRPILTEVRIRSRK